MTARRCGATLTRAGVPEVTYHCDLRAGHMGSHGCSNTNWTSINNPVRPVMRNRPQRRSVQVSVRLQPEIAEQLRSLAAARGIGMQDEIRLLIADEARRTAVTW